MDRREFLKLMASTGALAATGGYGLIGCGASSTDGNRLEDKTRLPESKVDYISRNPDGSLSPYLVIPKLDYWYPQEPEWLNWGGVAWTDYPHPPHGFWFHVPEVGESEDVVLPVINLGNMTTRHLIVELYEGPRADTMSLSDCDLVERKGPYTLHPGRITGFPMTYTRRREEGASVAICYDPFYDPIHTITAVGRLSADRKNLGNCNGLRPPRYPGPY